MKPTICRSCQKPIRFVMFESTGECIHSEDADIISNSHKLFYLDPIYSDAHYRKLRNKLEKDCLAERVKKGEVGKSVSVALNAARDYESPFEVEDHRSTIKKELHELKCSTDERVSVLGHIFEKVIDLKESLPVMVFNTTGQLFHPSEGYLVQFPVDEDWTVTMIIKTALNHDLLISVAKFPVSNEDGETGLCMSARLHTLVLSESEAVNLSFERELPGYYNCKSKTFQEFIVSGANH